MSSQAFPATLNGDNDPSTATTKKPSHWQLVASHALLTPAVVVYKYHGSGTEDEPYLVEFIPNDHRDPMNFPQWKKWMLTLLVAFATLAVSFASSAYTGGVNQIITGLHSSDEEVVLGVSFFVLGVSLTRGRLVRNVVDEAC